MKLKAITIDFWNTLFDSTNGNERNKYRMRALVNEIDKFGIMIDQMQFEDAMKQTWNFFNKVWEFEKRTPLPKESIEFCWNYLKLPQSKESIDILIEEFAISGVKFPSKLIDGVEEILPKLAEQFELGIISDTGFTPGVLLKEVMAKNNIYQYFKSFSFSDETGVSKPHPLAYTTVLDHLEVMPTEALHIGDIERTDIQGAKTLGMKSIRFSGDKTGFVTNPNTTQADAEAFTWKEVFEIIERMKE